MTREIPGKCHQKNFFTQQSMLGNEDKDLCLSTKLIYTRYMITV